MKASRSSVCAVVLATLTFALSIYVILGPRADGNFSTKAPGAYYGFLTDALLSGQTYLKLQPDPGLKLLKNPWAGNQGVMRLHDATYFNDRYYLYFSFIPVVLFDAPWRLLAGEFPTDGATTFVCACFSVVLLSFVLRQLWLRWFDSLALLAISLLLAAFATHIAVSAESSSVYEVPITAANACMMAALFALCRFLFTTHHRAQENWMVCVSLGWGLAVACRPNYIFGLLAFGLVIISLATKSLHTNGRAAALRLVATAVVPAAIVGSIVAYYNFIRFGSPSEFGMTYQFAAGDQRTIKLLAVGAIRGNIETYLLQSALFSPYFPYVILREGGIGLLHSSPIASLSLLWPATLLHRPFRRDHAWIALGVTLSLTFWLNLLSVSLLPTSNERYRADFTPYATVLGIITVAGLLKWVRDIGATKCIIATAHFSVLAAMVWTFGHSISLISIHYGRPLSLRPMARMANAITQQVERWRGAEFGQATIRVRFPLQTPGRYEPLLVSGHGQDILYVQYLEESKIQIGFHHVGAGGPLSDPITIKPNQEYSLTLNLGCLYPPANHPVFSGWPEPQIKLLQRQLVVSLDGQKMLASGSEFYPTDPWDIHFGENPGPYLAPGRFTGVMGRPLRAGLPTTGSRKGASGMSAVRMSVRFPAFRHFYSEPLISTGHSTAGDLLYVTYLSPNRIRFGHDSWGGGSIETPSVVYDPNEPQELELEMPSLSGHSDTPDDRRFILRYNGKLIMVEDRPYRATDASEMFFGFNGSDSTAATMVFSGKFDRIENVPRLAVSDTQFQKDVGPIRLALRFPQKLSGRSEPLVVTGRAGAADLVFIHYVDDAHVRFGYDHWSAGGPLSPPIAVDYLATHIVEVQMSSLLPAKEDARWSKILDKDRAALSRMVVKLDGQIVLSHDGSAYPCAPEEIRVGKNPIGASSCAEEFLGRIFFREKLGLAPLTPP